MISLLVPIERYIEYLMNRYKLLFKKDIIMSRVHLHNGAGVVVRVLDISVTPAVAIQDVQVDTSWTSQEYEDGHKLRFLSLATVNWAPGSSNFKDVTLGGGGLDQQVTVTGTAFGTYYS